MRAFLQFFEKNGLLKLVISFILLGLFIAIYQNTHWKIFEYLIWVPIGYIGLAFILFFIAAGINTINDLRKKK